jgi:hypothetical protein
LATGERCATKNIRENRKSGEAPARHPPRLHLCADFCPPGGNAACDRNRHPLAVPWHGFPRKHYAKALWQHCGVSRRSPAAFAGFAKLAAAAASGHDIDTRCELSPFLSRLY